MNNIKNYIKERYSKVTQKPANSCCSSTCCDEGFNDDYKDLNGYNPDADYGLGCGLPTKFAKLKEGDVVLDLGAGAGNDCFVARAEVGETGKVYGLDFSEAMLKKAKENNHKLGYKNVTFLLGDIEEIPLEDNSIDVVVSNCVLNLVPNKEKVFSEIFRVLKPGGHFSIADVVTSHTLPNVFLQNADLVSECVAGAISKKDYLQEIDEAGFKNMKIQKEKDLPIPNAVQNHFSIDDGFRLLSLSIYGEKIA